jgi:glycosyltransferase involved in cell wall biosynthesis
MLPMRQSSHIVFELRGDTWDDIVKRLCVINDLDPTRVIVLPILAHDLMRQIYAQTDIGLFTNRGEGGTNLVMMEYMACGRSVIATYATGHRDVLADEYAYLLRSNTARTYEMDAGILADWYEPSVEETVELLEYAYQHRSELVQKGMRAAEAMRPHTWARCAEDALLMMGLT